MSPGKGRDNSPSKGRGGRQHSKASKQEKMVKLVTPQTFTEQQVRMELSPNNIIVVLHLRWRSGPRLARWGSWRWW